MSIFDKTFSGIGNVNVLNININFGKIFIFTTATLPNHEIPNDCQLFNSFSVSLIKGSIFNIHKVTGSKEGMPITPLSLLFFLQLQGY